jgi:biopolymer transport protein TolQ
LSFLLVAIVDTSDITRLVANTGMVARVVLLILLVFSVFSWAVIFAKWARFRRARIQSDRFMRAFRRSRNFSELDAVSDQFRPSPLVALFEHGYEELRNQVSGGTPHGSPLQPANLLSVQRALQIGASEQLTGMERMLSWLATTGAVTPFIGLFGTVWGIMDAFHGLGTSGAASIRAVAPGISEALVTTAAGLFVAIPAVIFYNFFLHGLRDFGSRMDNFSLEFLNVAERNYAAHGE